MQDNQIVFFVGRGWRFTANKHPHVEFVVLVAFQNTPNGFQIGVRIEAKQQDLFAPVDHVDIHILPVVFGTELTRLRNHFDHKMLHSFLGGRGLKRYGPKRLRLPESQCLTAYLSPTLPQHHRAGPALKPVAGYLHLNRKLVAEVRNSVSHHTFYGHVSLGNSIAQTHRMNGKRILPEGWRKPLIENTIRNQYHVRQVATFVIVANVGQQARQVCGALGEWNLA